MIEMGFVYQKRKEKKKKKKTSFVYIMKLKEKIRKGAPYPKLSSKDHLRVDCQLDHICDKKVASKQNDHHIS
jgi:hypothetical protein